MRYKLQITFPARKAHKLLHMRVCLISREYPPETGWGGIGTFMHHLAHGLKDARHDVEVVSLAGAQQAEPEICTSDYGIPVHRIKPIKIDDDRGLLNFCLPTSRPMLEEVAALWQKFLERHKEKPFDIAEAPEHFAEAVFVAVSRCVPLVIRLHTPHSKLLAERFHNFKPSFDHRFLATAERIAMLSADKLVSPSEDLAGYVSRDLNYPLEEIAIIHNPVDAEKFSPEGFKALNSDGPIALFVGRLEERKGVHQLVEAIPKVLTDVKTAKFVIIGGDTMTGKDGASVFAEMNQALEASGAGHAVQFIPRIELSEIANYYRAADVFVLPSLYDNAPCTVIEAMSCGKPVVGTSAGGTREYAIDGECGLIVPPGDSEQLATALISLLSDSDRRQQMGLKARSRVLQHFTKEQMTRRTVELYQTAIQNWQISHRSAIYRGKPEELLPQFLGLLDASHSTLYDLVFLHSLSFRLEHWGEKARRRPADVLGKLFGGD